MCEAGDMKMDKAQDLPGNVCSSMGSGIKTAQRPRDMSSRGQGPYQGKLLGGHGRVRFASWRREETFQKGRTASKAQI